MPAPCAVSLLVMRLLGVPSQGGSLPYQPKGPGPRGVKIPNSRPTCAANTAAVGPRESVWTPTALSAYIQTCDASCATPAQADTFSLGCSRVSTLTMLHGRGRGLNLGVSGCGCVTHRLHRTFASSSLWHFCAGHQPCKKWAFESNFKLSARPQHFLAGGV